MNRKFPFMKTTSTLTLLGALLASTACVVGPDYEPAELDVPAQFVEAPGDTPDAASLEQWWKTFNDPVLDALVAETLAANDDLHVAFARLNEARALAGQSRTQWLPDASLSAGHTYRRQSLTTPEMEAAGVGRTVPRSSVDRDSDFFDTTFDAQWEADLWGRVRRSVEAADATTQARLEDMSAVRVSVLGELAANYIRYRETQTRLALNERLLASQRETLRLTRVRFEQGAGDVLDVHRGEALVATTEASIPALRAREAELAAALSVLAAQPIGQLRELLGPAGVIPAVPTELSAAGVPADLLRRRPDLRAAEQELRAAIARIGMEKADYYPRFTLSGSLGWTATEMGSFNADSSLTGGFGPRVSWAFLNIPEVRKRVEAAGARAEASLATYQKTLRVAVAEVETAAAGWREEESRHAALERAVEHYRKSVELSRQRYTAGEESYLDVLDAERQRLDAENSLATSAAERARQLVALYRALGGGWTPEQAEAETETAESDSTVDSKTGG
ncbi:MAG: outer membrane protein multidrug efflux system [Candidatus Sumerlaeota bacterium]|nr:outer membrane protein multidrug efflux system [Candidatus Sumerlaeota bacterium]